MFLGYLEFNKHLNKSIVNRINLSQGRDIENSGEFFENDMITIAFGGAESITSNYHSNNYFGDESKYTFFFSGTIYNREELLNDLSGLLPNVDLRKCPESEIFRTAYRKWGKLCFVRIVGDWVCILFDENKKEVLLCKDHHGISALYYHFDGNKLVYSDSLKTLKASFPEYFQELNYKKLISNLSNQIGIIDSTTYSGISKLISGHYTQITHNKKNIIKYWDPFDKGPIRYKNTKDYYDHFLEIFNNVIKCRVNPNENTGIFLSGGLDSASIAAVTAHQFKSLNKDLTSYTSIPAFELIPPDHLIYDESKLVNQIIASYTNITPRFLSCKGVSPLENVEKELNSFGEPVHAAGNLFWIRSLFEKAKEDGINRLITGQNGNTTFSWPYPMVSKYYDRGWIKNRLTYFHHCGIDLFQKSLNRENYLNYYTKTLLINKRQFEHNKIYTRRGVSNRTKKYLNIDFRQKMIYKKSLSQGLYWKYLSNKYSITVTDPSTDPRLIDYCVNIPYNIYYSQFKGRALIRRSMQGLLPYDILNNEKHGLQSADLNLRLKQDKERIAEIIQKFKGNPSIDELMDVVKMERLVEQLFSNENQSIKSIISSKLLLRGIMTGLHIQNMS